MATAVGAVALVAVLVAGGVVGWVQVTADRPAARPAPLEPVPTELPGGRPVGDVPPEIAAAVDGPVVGALVFDELPEEADVCLSEFGAAGSDDAELRWAVLTPDEFFISVVGGGPETGPRAFPGGGPPPPGPPGPPALSPEASPGVRPSPPAPARVAVPEARRVPPGPDEPGQAAAKEATSEMIAPVHPGLEPGQAPPEQFFCSMTFDGGWRISSAGSMPEQGHDDVGVGTSTSCCDERGVGTASTMARVPPEAAWALQERDGFWVAYPAGGQDVLPMTWRFRPNPGGRTGATHVLWLDAGGDTLHEEFISG